VADRPDGQVELITATARGEHGELRAVRLTVIDNGPGFADKVPPATGAHAGPAPAATGNTTQHP